MKPAIIPTAILCLASCAASTPRMPSSKSGFALLARNYLVCLESDDKAHHGFYLHHDVGHEFRFHYDSFDAPAWNAVALCRERANGISCAVKGHPDFRLEYAFENHPARHIEGSEVVPLASYQEVDFGAHRFDCFITQDLTEDFTGVGVLR